MNNNTIGLKEAAQLAGVSRDTLRRAIQRGELPALLVTGKTGPQFHVEEIEIQRWMQKRLTAYPMWQEAPVQDEPPDRNPQEPVTVQTVQQGSSDDVQLDRRLATLEENHRDQSLALVRLAIQQDLIQSVQKWKERAGVNKSKVSKLRKQLADIADLTEQNRRNQELWEAEKEQLVRELKTHQERVTWLEKRVPRWVRGIFGAK